jgi:molybdopterin/thiamine biosynthesis adenylyltransferase
VMLSAPELIRYSRQIPALGEEGQQKLQAACVFIAGAGGLGTAVSVYLAAAGVGSIRLADPDRVELSNLNRQIFYSGSDAASAKAVVLRERLQLLNPHIRIEAFVGALEDANADDLAGDASALIDALDNVPDRLVLNRLSLRRGIPLIHAAVREFYGHVTVVVPRRTACLSCLWGRSEAPGPIPVVGAVCGVIGSIQACEAIKLLTGKGENLSNRLFVWDGLRAESEIVELAKNPACPECGEKQSR